jgi:glycosyltransferase involved in cell wall biosynthesis
MVERERLPGDKITVIPNGIDLGRFPVFSLDRRGARRAVGRNPLRRIVAQIGRFAMEKDWPTFLRAAAILAAQFPDVDFLAVGEGPHRQELETLAARLGLTGRISFTGPRDDVPALLAAVDVLTLSSITEGFPNVLLEAMATGAVPVATDVGGCGEIVTAGETGFLVPPHAPAALAAAVARVLHDGALARRLALAGRRRVDSGLAVEHMAERTMEFYRSLLRVNRGPATIAAA